MSVHSEHIKVATFIDEHPLGVVAIDRQHRPPYAASVFFVRDDDLNLYFITKTQTEKYKALNEREHVSATISDMHAQQTVQAEGVAIELTTDGRLLEEIFKKLSHIKPPGNSNWLPPIVKLKAGDYALFQIKVSRMRYGDFLDALSQQNRTVFRSVIG